MCAWFVSAISQAAALLGPHNVPRDSLADFWMTILHHLTSGHETARPFTELWATKEAIGDMEQ